MSKAIAGAIELGGAVAMGALAFMDPAVLASPWYTKVMFGLAMEGIATEAGAIAGALTSNRGMGVTTRQPASFRQIIRGEQRVAGTIVYCSTVGGGNRHYKMVIVLATHEIDSIVNMYLDGRQVIWNTGSTGYTVRNGVGFGGYADPGTYRGPDGKKYSFGSLVHAVAYYGDQNVTTGYNAQLAYGVPATDPAWVTTSYGTPYLGGCAYVVLDLGYDTGQFPQLPEIRFTVRGKNDIWDPRTSTRGYSSNWALQVADAITDSKWGLGDDTVNQAQLIAAANVCDELVTCAAGSEKRYALHWHYDTSMAPGDVIAQMMNAAAGRLSRIGGEWFIWPAYWQGPSFSFDEDALADEIQWTPKRPLSDLCNRVEGTYIAPNYPYNVAGNLYDSNGYWAGHTANNFPYAFQPTNYPAYAADALHGYGAGVDVFLTEDGGIYLPKEVAQPCVLSISQAQRVAKIILLRNRQQGTGTFSMKLAAWQMQPTDVMNFTMSSMGWLNKQLEVSSLKFKFGMMSGQDVPSCFVELAVQETDISVYEWTPGFEELNPYDIVQFANVGDYVVPPVTGLTLQDDSSTALMQSDGTNNPRLLVSWTPPVDTFVNNGGHIELQYQYNSVWGDAANPIVPLNTWIDFGLLSGQATYCYIDGINDADVVTVQVRCVRSNGAVSAWVSQSTARVRPVGRPKLPWVLGSGSPVPLIQYPGGINVEILQPAEAGATLGATWGTNLKQQPQDLQNMVLKSNFDDGTMGTWNGDVAIAVTGQDFSYALRTASRDVLETGNQFPVVAGQKYFVQGWIFTAGTPYSASIGLEFLDSSGAVVAWVTGATLTAASGWTFKTGWLTVPAGAVSAVPWLQQDGTTFSSDFALYSGIYIGKHQPGADITAEGTSALTASLSNQTLDALPDGSTFLRVPATVYGPTGAAVDSSGNLKLKNTKSIPGITTNPTLSTSAFADLPELGSGNAAMTVLMKGNPALLGANLEFLAMSGSGGGTSGPVVNIGYSFGSSVNASSPPSVAISISGDGSGASASVTWSMSGSYPTFTWTPELHLTGGSGYTSATATITITNGTSPYSNGTYTDACTIQLATPQANVPIQARVLMDGIVVMGPTQIQSDSNGGAIYNGTQMIFPDAGSHSFQVQARTLDTSHPVYSAYRAAQLIELG